MGITTSEPPDTALNALRSGMDQMRGAPAPMESRGISLAAKPNADSHEGAPHPIYALGLDAILQRRGLDAAQAVGWRYLIGRAAEHPAVAAEVHQRGPDDHRFAGLNEGPFVGQLMATIRRIESQPEIRDGDFEPRLLRAPAVYVAALWLKDRRTGHDIVIPLDHSDPGVRAGDAYTAEDFMAALAAIAAKRQAPSTSERGPSAP
jgi:hypothetical protein